MLCQRSFRPAPSFVRDAPGTDGMTSEELIRTFVRIWEELQQLKRQIDVEEARIQRLEKCADNWHRAKRIREYVLALVQHRTKQGKVLSSETALGKWATWALQQADRLDPLEENARSIVDRKSELEGWSPYGGR